MANGEFNYNLSDFIVVMRKLVPAEKCAEMIETCEGSSFWQMAKVGYSEGVRVDLKMRKVQELYVTDSQVKSSDPKFDRLDEDLFQYVLKAGKIYTETLSSERNMQHLPHIVEDEGYTFLHYQEGYYFKEHCDDAPGINRTLTLTINLNEDYDGGLFKFFNEEISVSLKTGDAIMFPSNFMFPHEVTKITRGERYSMVTWFH